MTTIDFVAAEFSTIINAPEAQIADMSTASIVSNAVAYVDVKLSEFASVFNFWTDSLEVNDVASADLKFLFKPGYDAVKTLGGVNLNWNAYMAVGTQQGAEGTMYAKVDPSNNNLVSYDYTRYLALKLFNTIRGVDLFSNESTIRTGLNEDFTTSFRATIAGLNQEPCDYQEDLTSEDYSITQSMLYQLLSTETGRARFSTMETFVTDSSGNALKDGSGNYINGSGNKIPQPYINTTISPLNNYGKWYKLPLIIGDNMSFLITVNAATGQHELTQVPEIADRTYKIVMTFETDAVVDAQSADAPWPWINPLLNR